MNRWLPDVATNQKSEMTLAISLFLYYAITPMSRD